MLIQAKVDHEVTAEQDTHHAVSTGNATNLCLLVPA